jgi:hypothetical protein
MKSLTLRVVVAGLIGVVSGAGVAGLLLPVAGVVVAVWCGAGLATGVAVTWFDNLSPADELDAE